jgi:hypothetical protein
MTDKDRIARLLPWLLKLMRSFDFYAGEEASIRELMNAVRLHFRGSLAGQVPSRALR